MAPSSWFTLLFALSAISVGVRAVPAPHTLTARQDAIIPLPPAEIAAFKPYTWYASTANCNPSSTKAWNCGENCDANPTFEPVDSGGDGIFTQFWYVGYDPTLNVVVVGHQGTDVSKIIPVLIDLDIPLVQLDAELFPGVDPSVRVHQGFAGTQSRSAPGVLAAVEEALSLYPTKNVTVVGHSLGAAIALLDAVYLPLHLPSDVNVRYIGYASPRVGDQAWANYVDSLHMNITRINNKEDPVPVLPPIEIFGYHHASGEVHIRDDDVWVSCPGQDNPSDQCSTGAVNITTFDAAQHPGPYDGVTIQC
ncbi:alpha/beta-hydrolase [Dichomitus squalens LYAD-421 SS1]|uniref:alpha/beta-hydrolase n=1 Tax=Dichomitus squalens (strain LYAD-421) TaxID=732165 RepID=UPI0004411BD0|nr:alpha/beta-hydrolase [Dichomitus squalens LYAD-421 SS1]EJF64419.1 alpha/beta-hydrolase [Dichomitus squalens LYAD-421 SS1]